jgi:S-DNA-T family DNA segregation ATPase FtsK/SpoIIIE
MDYRARRSEILGLIVISITILIFLALVTDGYQSDVRRPIDGMSEAPNVLGRPGATVAGILSLLLGGGAHCLYFVTGVWGGLLLRHKPLDRSASRAAGAVVLTFAMSALLHIDVPANEAGDHLGGIIGGFFGTFFLEQFGMIGANVICVTFVLIGTLLATELLLIRVLDRVRHVTIWVLHVTSAALAYLGAVIRNTRGRRPWAVRSDYEPLNLEPEGPELLEQIEAVESEIYERVQQNRNAPQQLPLNSGYDEDIPEPSFNARDEARIRIHTTPRMPDAPADDEALAVDAEFEEGSIREDPAARLEEAETKALESIAKAGTLGSKPNLPSRSKTPALPRRKTMDDELPEDYVYPKRYTRPSIELFDPAEEPEVADWSEHLLATSALLEDTLHTFGIEARVTDVTRGPTITRYELEPAPGIKVSRFASLADDIALALKAHRVRVEAPIPGKGRVGIEVPNKIRESVVIRELLESRIFTRSKTTLPLTLGKDIAGDVMVADLTTMPHLLVAGATGAGKTVCVKTLLASLLCVRTPDELQLMLIDPKMVELSIFNDIPHLITPVVIDPKKAASALNWLIVEMEERYRLFAHLRVRNIDVYNQSVENGEIEMVAEDGEENGESVDAIRKLPYIVCIIDELADLMMLARAEVEDAIARLAQLARAVGIHLVIATQRPSVDVLTGVIKANFPCRISFQVSSRVDSRCILDEIGAERLIGKGDMLYLPAGQSKPTRIQGAFVSDAEMNGLIAYLKTQAPPQYRDEIANFGKSKDAMEDMGDQDDELFDDAIRVVLETGQASISMVQRRLRVGYTRAARLIDMMEMRGIVGPHSGSKAREILVSVAPNDEVA